MQTFLLSVDLANIAKSDLDKSYSREPKRQPPEYSDVLAGYGKKEIDHVDSFSRSGRPNDKDSDKLAQGPEKLILVAPQTGTSL